MIRFFPAYVFFIVFFSLSNAFSSIDTETEALFLHKLCESAEIQPERQESLEACGEIPVILGDGESVAIIKTPSLVIERKQLSQVRFLGLDESREQVLIRFGQAISMDLKSLLNEAPELVLHSKGLALKLIRVEDISEGNEIRFLVDIQEGDNQTFPEIEWLREVSKQTQLSTTKIARSNFLTYIMFAVCLFFTAGFLVVVFRKKN